MGGVLNILRRNMAFESDDWASLFGLADVRFILIHIRRPPKSKLSCIEVVWEGDETS